MKKYVIKSIKGDTIENLLSRFTYSYSSDTHFYKLGTLTNLGTTYRLFNFGIYTVNVDMYIGDVMSRRLNCETNSFIDFTLDPSETLNNVQGNASFLWTAEKEYLFKHSLVLMNRQDRIITRFFDSTIGVGKPCANLFNTTTWTNGKLEPGGLVIGGMYANYMTSDFIPVTGGRTVIAKGYYNDTVYPVSILAYDLSGIVVAESTNTYCVLPQNAIKIKITLNAIDKANINNINIMIEYNQASTKHEKYYEGYKISILSKTFNYDLIFNNELKAGTSITYNNHTYKINDQEVKVSLSSLGLLELYSTDTIKIDSMAEPTFDVEVFDDYNGNVIESPVPLIHSEYLYWDNTIHRYKVSPTGEIAENIKEIIKLKLPGGGGISG